ncbi:MAG: hypothetical protein WBQ17_06370 [Rhizomicrobium sp.]
MTIRVIQWATGAIGKTCLRQIIDHPDLELAGLFVYSQSKIGKDAGEIARRENTGIIATNSVDEIVNTPADVVLHLPLNPAGSYAEHDEIIKRLLRSGKSVITTIAHTYPLSEGAEYARGFEDACREGNSVLFGTGINPGLIAERLAVLFTSVCTKVDAVRVREVYDISDVRSPGFIFDLCGVGQSEESVRNGPRVKSVFKHIFGEVVGYVGHALKVDFDEIKPDHEFAIADRDIVLPAGEVKAGGVVNFRWRFHGMKGGKPFFTIQMLWIADRTIPGWDYSDGWEVEIDGLPGIKARVDLVEPEGMRDKSKAMQYCVAGPVIRAIPEVMKAEPGVLVVPTFAPYTPRM